MTIAVIEKPEPQERVDHALGVYWNLDEDSYHADIALGSTDIRRLARDPREFWWGSRFNTISEEDDEESESKGKDAKLVGKAMHAAVLEGREALEARFAPAFHKGNVKAGIEERKIIAAEGKEPIRFKAWKRTLVASSIIRNDPYVGEAFNNTIGTELSVFWQCPRTGMKKKARFDAVKMRALVDFKTITNRDDKVFEQLCHEHIGKYGYYTQAAYYLDAWDNIPTLLASGAVFNAPSPEHVARLKKAAANELTAFVFVFLQKAGAPLVWGTTISPGNGLIDNARDDIELAEANWKEYVAKFGTDQPWLLSKPLAELDINEIPAWTFRRY
jgi:hypothetical protein